MNNIRSYKDLLLEKQRLEADLVHQKAAIRNDLMELREEFKPAINLVSLVGKITKPGKAAPLTAIGLGLVADFLLKKTLLSTSGRISQAVVPFLVKKGGSLIQNLAAKWKGKRVNGRQ